MHETARRSVKALRELGKKIQGMYSYVTDNKVYCVYLAPDEETILKHAKMIGLPANRISAVRQLLDAGDGE